jgi:hypothetical protein
MSEIFSLPGDHSKERDSNIDALGVYNILDDDPILAELCNNKFDEESGKSGEYIWPSNMVSFDEDKVFGSHARIDGQELNTMIENVLKSVNPNDLERSMKIQQLVGNKAQIIQRIYEMLQDMHFESIEIINEK